MDMPYFMVVLTPLEFFLGVEFEMVGQDPVVELCNVVGTLKLVVNHCVLYPLIPNLELSMAVVWLGVKLYQWLLDEINMLN